MCAARPHQVTKARARHKLWRDKNRDVLKEYARRRVAQERATVVEKVDYKSILASSNGVCGICKLDIGDAPYEFDHIVPLARGGSHTMGNIQVAHRRCNRSKGAKVAA